MLPATTVFIARHGERIDHVNKQWPQTAANPYDPFLTETGIAQARALGEYLKTKELKHIFVSPFYRTVQTANQVSLQTGVPLKLEYGLCEFLNPRWYDHMPILKSADELHAEFRNIDTSYVSQWQPKFPEEREDCIVRAGWTARTLASKYSGNILFVGHGMTCEFTARGLTAAGIRPYISYCSLQEVQLKDDGTYSIGGRVEVDIDFMEESIRPVPWKTKDLK